MYTQLSHDGHASCSISAAIAPMFFTMASMGFVRIQHGYPLIVNSPSSYRYNVPLAQKRADNESN